MMHTKSLASLLEAFFLDRLIRQRQASPETVASYRDAFRLLLSFAQERLKKQPSSLTIEDLDSPFIGTFLEHLEKDRGNSARTRNIRLAAIRSFFGYLALQEPASSAVIQRVLAIPNKRHKRKPVDFLTRPEMEALLAAPDLKTWAGRRDHALLLLALQTGLRLSELIGLRCEDVILGAGAHVRCQGKGRKERCTPLLKDTVPVLRHWLRECAHVPANYLFPNTRGGPLSRSGVQYLVAKHIATAKKRCPSLDRKRVSPHVLRHSAAMAWLQCGIDRSVIALLLGHESADTTQMYLHASLELKEKALAKTDPLDAPSSRYRPDDTLLEFLKSL